MQKKLKKCRYCKELFQPYTSLQKYCTNIDCLRVFIAEINSKEEKRKQKKRKESLMNIQDYLKLAQQVFNKYIRLRDKDELCISCQKKPKKINAGHYYSVGGHSNVRFDEDNVHLQCEACNTYLSGNLIEFGINLEKKIGKEEFEYLRNRAYIVKKWQKDELLSIIETYKLKIKNQNNKL